MRIKDDLSVQQWHLDRRSFSIFAERTHFLTQNNQLRLQGGKQVEGRGGFCIPRALLVPNAPSSLSEFLTHLMFTELSVTSYLEKLSQQGWQNGAVHLEHTPQQWALGSHRFGCSLGEETLRASLWRQRSSRKTPQPARGTAQVRRLLLESSRIC